MQKRLWLCGGGLLLFIVTMAIANAFSPADKAVTRKNAGHDFIAFYTAGTLVRTGQADKLYDLPSVREYQQNLAQNGELELGRTFGPYWNPPFFALVFAPLSLLPYHTAWNVWFVMNLTAAAVAITLLTRMVAQIKPDWRFWGLVPLLIIPSLPFIQALSHGQNTCISLLLLTGAVTLWRSQKMFFAGLVAGLLFYKPQLGALVAAAMILLGGRRALLGIAVTGTVLLLITVLTLPGTLSDFLARLPQNVAYMQVEHRYAWERHVTLKAFWRLLIQGFAIGDLTIFTRICYLATTAACGFALLWTLWRARGAGDRSTIDRAIAVTVCAMPLLMPFYFDYDLLLLAVPAVLFGIERLRGRVNPWALRAWIALYVWQFVNAPAGGASRVNLTVVLLSAVTTMMIASAWRRDVDELNERPVQPARLAA